MMKNTLIRWTTLMFAFFYMTALVIGQSGKESPVIKSADDILKDQEQDRVLIDKIIPEEATAAPKKPRRLLIFDLNVNYGGHKSIPHASYAFTKMGEATGAFETVITSDTMAFQKNYLKQFDAVFFNNTVGNQFQDEKLRKNLQDFVKKGGGLMGVHGASVAFCFWPGAKDDWPEFGVMLGARGSSHRENKEHVFIKVEDPNHPVNQVFKKSYFEYEDEFYRFKDPYSRDLVHVLLSFDTNKTDMNQGRGYGDVVREDGDYPIAWVKQYGKGKVFHCTIGHHPEVFMDPMMLQFYLDALQFVLGDLEGSVVPSSQL